MESQIKSIETGKLSVDTTNFRIGDQESIRDAYRAMIDEEGANLVNLADDIVKIGLSPADPFIICPDPDNARAYIVCEGNRRLTCLRLLETPALATGTAVHKRFVTLAQEYAKNPIRVVLCVEMRDKEAALQWIERKHLGMEGRGVAQWGSTATGRAQAFRGKVRPSIAIVDHLRTHRLLPSALASALSTRMTNLDRVFQMPYVRSALGIGIEKDGTINFANGDEKKGSKLLQKMASAMTEPGFNVNDIRHAGDRRDFIDRFGIDAVLANDGGDAAATPAPQTSAGSRAPTKQGIRQSTRPAPSPLERKTLALGGREFVLHITEPRLNALYREAQSLNPDVLPNSAAVLTRVFLELSTDHFLTKKKVPIPTKHLGKKHWSDIGIRLNEKMETALRTIDPTYKDPLFKEVRRGISGTDALHSIDALHEVMHQLSADRDPKEVKRIWMRWHPYLAALFDTLAPGK